MMLLLMLVSKDGGDDGLSDLNMDMFHDVPLEIRLDVLRNKEANMLNYQVIIEDCYTAIIIDAF